MKLIPQIVSFLLLLGIVGQVNGQARGTKDGRIESHPEQIATCHGTSVEFVDSPIEAAKLAAKQKKLVFVLHVSGHFEDPNFT